MKEIICFAEDLLDQTGKIACEYFRSDLKISRKDDASPVTIADLKIEDLIRKRIESVFPDHGIIGEEHGSVRENADYIWHIDPIDGTIAFIHGLPLFGTLMGLTYRGKPILGFVDQPFIGDRWIGGKEYGTTHNRHVVKTRQIATLDQASLIVTSPDYLESFGPQITAGMHGLQGTVQQNLFGAGCYASGLLASGHLDLILSAGLKSWDYLSRLAIIEGAGGVMTDWQGNRPEGHKVMVVAAGSAALHAQSLDILKGVSS
ncbi:MAG: inositol monophosphatase family protein [Alphaproteobacteria bacterium]